VDILANLPATLRAVRTLRGQSLREVAKDAGMSFSTVTRIENGEDCALSSAIAILRWIARGES
jgi:transcriptional regulator with XRE-family HTH domain